MNDSTTIRSQKVDKIIFYSLEDMLKHAELNSGQFSLLISNNTIDFKFFPNGSNTLLIFFNAAVSRAKQRVLPVFSGMGALGKVDTNILMVSDPSLELSEDLSLAWYAGNQKFRLQVILSNVLKKFSDRFGKDRTILYGGSGGGFAAIYYSTKIPNSYAVAANPQTNISKYNKDSVIKFLSVCFPDVSREKGIEDSLRSANIDYEVFSSYSKSSNRLIYLQNTSDNHHMKNHLEPFLRHNGFESIGQDKIVRNLNERVSVIMGQHWGRGHTGPPKELIFGLLDLLTTGIEHTSLSFAIKIKHLYYNSISIIDVCELFIEKDCFFSEIKVAEGFDLKKFKFAWYLYKDGARVEYKVYIETNLVKFDTPVEKGVYWAVGFVRGDGIRCLQKSKKICDLGLLK